MNGRKAKITIIAPRKLDCSIQTRNDADFKTITVLLYHIRIFSYRNIPVEASRSRWTSVEVRRSWWKSVEVGGSQ